MTTITTTDDNDGTTTTKPEERELYNPNDCNKFTVQDLKSPSSPFCCFGWKWHPTHATLVSKEEDGRTYHWTARSHRKLRYVHEEEEEGKSDSSGDTKSCCNTNIRFICWEPHIVTFHIIWIGIIANTLWVINGMYATWGAELSDNDFTVTMMTYLTGAIGAFLFIVTGYLGYVEAINHSHAPVRTAATTTTTTTVAAKEVENENDDDNDEEKANGGENENNEDDDEEKETTTAVKVANSTTTSTEVKSSSSSRREFVRPLTSYGRWDNPVVHKNAKHKNNDPHDDKFDEYLLNEGYPLVQDVVTGNLITAPLFTKNVEQHGIEEMQQLIQGRVLEMRIGNNLIKFEATGWEQMDEQQQQQPTEEGEGNSSSNDAAASSEGYRWWSWRPDLHHIAVVNSIIFFIATILFFLPAVLWYPMAESDASLGSTMFWVFALQIIPSMGFIYVGHASMAEASGSWIRPQWNSIGWWISLFNAIGGYGFLLYPILAIPNAVDGGHLGLLKWGASLSTFWGSCAFFIAGILQCIEFSSEHPIRW